MLPIKQALETVPSTWQVLTKLYFYYLKKFFFLFSIFRIFLFLPLSDRARQAPCPCCGEGQQARGRGASDQVIFEVDSAQQAVPVRASAASRLLQASVIHPDE